MDLLVTKNFDENNNLYDSSPDYKTSVTGRDRSGTMNFKFFDNKSSNVRIPDIYNYQKAILQDYAYTGNSMTENETPPESTGMMDALLNFHTYGTLNPTVPFTEEGVDSQFRDRDPRGFNLDNIQWNDALEISKKKALNYDFAPSGDVVYDSGTISPHILQEKIANAFYMIKALYKNFTESLYNPRPHGLLHRDITQVPSIRYNNIFNDEFPIPLEDVNRKMLPQSDVKFRSLTVPTHVPSISGYGMGIKANGLTTLGSQVNSIIYNSADPQMEGKVQLSPVNNKILSSVLKNSIVIEQLLNEQLKQNAVSTSWINNNNQSIIPFLKFDTISDHMQHVLSTFGYKYKEKYVNNNGKSKFEPLLSQSISNKIHNTQNTNKNNTNLRLQQHDNTLTNNSLSDKNKFIKSYSKNLNKDNYIFDNTYDNHYISYNKNPQTNYSLDNSQNVLYNNNFNESNTSVNLSRNNRNINIDKNNVLHHNPSENEILFKNKQNFIPIKNKLHDKISFDIPM